MMARRNIDREGIRCDRLTLIFTMYGAGTIPSSHVRVVHLVTRTLALSRFELFLKLADTNDNWKVYQIIRTGPSYTRNFTQYLFII